MTIDEEKVSKILAKLQTNKAWAPAKIGYTVLKNLPALSKSLLMVFQAAFNKGYSLHIGKRAK